MAQFNNNRGFSFSLQKLNEEAESYQEANLNWMNRPGLGRVWRYTVATSSIINSKKWTPPFSFGLLLLDIFKLGNAECAPKWKYLKYFVYELGRVNWNKKSDRI